MTSRLILGPPGCGKTHTLIEIVQKSLATGVAPDRIGYVSFTRKAVAEAMARAQEKFGLTAEQLPHFRTLHAFGYHGLGLNKGDVMAPEDWRILGNKLGLRFTGTSISNMDEGILLSSGSYTGDNYLKIINRAAMRNISIEQEFRELGNYDLSFEYLVKIRNVVESYKREFIKMDFTDMIRMFITAGVAPRLEVLIVDEAQDLVPLQWEMVRLLASNSRHVYYAGDDDQAIHRWAGVEVTEFMGAADDIQILGQSYRVPRAAYDVANQIVGRIHNRIEKKWNPTKEQGTVTYHRDDLALPIHEGSWTIMARTNAFIQDFAGRLRADGYFYSLKGVPSVAPHTASAIAIWRTLSTGGDISLSEAEILFKAAPKQGDDPAFKRGMLPLFAAEDPLVRLTYDDMVERFGLLAPRKALFWEVLRIGMDEALYIEAIERRNEDITAPPRLDLSTIHAMKGGEDENIALFLGSTKSAETSLYPDDEHRTFYVGVTRVIKNLHLIETQKHYRYQI